MIHDALLEWYGDLIFFGSIIALAFLHDWFRKR